MIAWRLSAFLISCVLIVNAPSRAADEGKGGERTKETPQSAEPKGESKKKQETEHKPDSSTKPAPEEKAPKAEEPAQPKPEDQAKKPVTSPNLTIKLALMADPSLFPFEIEVEVDNRKAVLSGTVPTEEDKARAADVARAVEGIESVTNKLTVSPPVRSTLTKKQDETIAQFVRERLHRSETLKAVAFEVKSENGIVHLSGKTRFQVIALEAAEAAKQVPGVRAVNTAGVQIVAN
jgi:hyperosmotically inducible protein